MSATDGLWAQRLRELALHEQKTMQLQLRQLNERIREAELLLKQLTWHRDRCTRDLDDMKEGLQRLNAWENDPLVLVRKSVGGFGGPVYHDAQHPCGHVWDKSRFQPMLLGEAEEKRFQPCSACGRQAHRRKVA